MGDWSGPPPARPPALPECSPALTRMGMSGSHLIQKSPTELRMSRAMLPISAVGRLLPLHRGSPDTPVEVSPVVST